MNARNVSGGLGLMVAITVGLSATACGALEHGGRGHAGGCTSGKAATGSAAKGGTGRAATKPAIPSAASGTATTATGTRGGTRLHDDFNGDGYSDFAFLTSVAEGPGARVSSVAVMYGSLDGLRSSAKEIVGPHTPGMPKGDAVGHQGIDELDSADLDRDGYADVIVSGGDSHAGSVSVIWGAPHGLADANALRDPVGSGMGMTTGSTVGDFDGDGAMDVATGVQSEPGKATPFDRLRVLYGPFDRLGTPAGGTREVKDPEHLTGAGDNKDSVAGIGDLTAGDVNGDGISDIVTVMNVGPTDGFVYKDHHVSYWRGSRQGLTPGVPVCAPPGSPSALKRIGIEALAVGDVNGDHRADIVIGRPDLGDVWDLKHDPRTKGGMITYLPGGPHGPDPGRARNLNQDSPGVPRVARGFTYATSDEFGYSLSLGDINGDGYGDVAVGANGYTRDVGGSVFTLLGTAHGLTGAGAKILNQDSPGMPGESGAYFGDDTKLVYADADGKADLVVGAPGEGQGVENTVNEEEDSTTGQIYVLRSTAPGVSPKGMLVVGEKELGTPTEQLGGAGSFNR